jgi:hypothetical protein
VWDSQPSVPQSSHVTTLTCPDLDALHCYALFHAFSFAERLRFSFFPAADCGVVVIGFTKTSELDILPFEGSTWDFRDVSIDFGIQKDAEFSTLSCIRDVRAGGGKSGNPGLPLLDFRGASFSTA